MLKRLRDLCANLQTATAPERRPLLQKEVIEVERRLETALESVQLRVVFLETLHGQWCQFNNDFDVLKEWTRKTAPDMIYALQSEEISLQDKLSRAQVLHLALSEKAKLLDSLESQAQQLIKGKSFF